MAQCFYFGPSLLGAEFVRDRDVPESIIMIDDCEWVCLTALHGLGSA